ncbi:MAG: hypothetical protein EOO39_02120 [Cytophagaceae bacterium]|nr:MAG: hypothetical protein EOO39_02120 [Cytophagaceae bacterium]
MRTLGLLLISLLVGYVIFAYTTGNWSLSRTPAEVDIMKLVSGAVFLILFYLYLRKRKEQ